MLAFQIISLGLSWHMEAVMKKEYILAKGEASES